MRIQNYILPLISAVLITLGCTQSFILDDSGIENPIPDAPEIPNNEIWYTSKDDTVVTPDSSANFGANIVSNTYENGKGVINFDGNIYKIGKFAFEFSSITSVILPNTVTTIERDAFSYTPLKSVYLPKNLETIEAEAFEYTSLDNIAIPDFVRNVGEFAFRATGIENVYINNLANWCSINFANWDANPIAGAGVQACLYVNNKKVTTLSFHSGLKVIKQFLFNNVSDIEEVIIHDNITTIEQYAFRYSNIKKVTLGKNVIHIGKEAFNCLQLSEIYCHALTPPELESKTVFSQIPSTCKIYVPVDAIDAYKDAYGWYDHRDKIKVNPETIPETYKIYYTSTNDYTVEPYLWSSEWGGSIISNTYENGQGVITCSCKITSIGKNAFLDRTQLKSITIPDGVTSIGEGAFSGCNNLECFYGKFASSDNRHLAANGALCSFAPAGLTQYTIPNNIRSVGGDAFYNCNKLTSVTIPNSVTSIGDSAFAYCSSLTSMTIPDSVTSIGGSTFAYCSSLAAFYGKYTSADNRCLVIDGRFISFAPADLTSYTIPNGVTSIGDGAFKGCSNLTSITIPNSITSIGDSTFSGCKNLKSANIPDGITTIGDDTFLNCSSLTNIIIPNNVTSIGNSAFSGCKNLTSITIPDRVTSILKFTFSGCNRLTSITIGNGVTSIGSYAFDNCENLTSVYCKPTTPPTGSSKMFDNNASGRKIYVPAGSVEAYKTAEYWKNYADAIVAE